jgi:hypothetical protein
MHSFSFRRAISIGIAGLLIAAGSVSAGQGGKDDRPRLSLKASPKVGRSPVRIVLTAELTGGADDYEEFYCPAVEWEWGDGTESESTLDCPPYEAGKSEIKRHFTVEHIFKTGGNHTIAFRLKRRDKVLASASVQVQVQPGVREMQGF